MSTLQYTFIRTSTLLFMGLKQDANNQNILPGGECLCMLWKYVNRVNVNIKHMLLLPILYCGTVMEALHNAEVNCLLCQ